MHLLEHLAHDTLPELNGNLQSPIGALPCDAWHHYYHYQSSAQYLWLAETLRMLGKSEEAMAAYERAIFQDHFNEEALEGKKRIGVRGLGSGPVYSKHPLSDAEFRASIGQPPSYATALHDEALTKFLRAEYKQAVLVLSTVIATEPDHSNSWFLRGKCYFIENRLEDALADFTEAIRLSHLRHDAYHRTASAEHLARGEMFLARSEYELAINDFTKALDLHKNNKEAFMARAKAYRAKGNAKLAQEDEEKANRA